MNSELSVFKQNLSEHVFKLSLTAHIIRVLHHIANKHFFLYNSKLQILNIKDIHIHDQIYTMHNFTYMENTKHIK